MKMQNVGEKRLSISIINEKQNAQNELVQIKKRAHNLKENVINILKTLYPEEWSIVGSGLSNTSKMPGLCYSIPASMCITGSKLAEVKGSTCYNCYALKGNYTYPVVNAALVRRIHSLNHPFWIPAMVTLIDKGLNILQEPYFRFHDAGDLQGVWHLENINEVAKMLPHVFFWLPTREYKFVTDFQKNNKVANNLVIRLSAHMNDQKGPSNLGLTSTVTTNHSPVTKDSVLCNAYNQEGFCKDCRLCWDKNIKDVTYPKH